MVLLNWNLTILLAVAGLLILYGVFLVERKGRWIAVIFLAAPVCFMMYRLAQIRDHMVELLTALGMSGLVFLLWYIAYGRQMPKPTSENIKVWTPDDTENGL